ncbi:TPA: 50S ribosomal protein L6, partial [Candidatus Taylorbacteria bacterium]|nr:50S ribosomal protein L6 [Candidatus Taylorbacteria bacterium]
EVTVNGSVVTVKGANGTLTRTIQPEIEVKVVEKEIIVSLKTETPESAVLWGTVSSHISNMVEGVNTPFVKRLLVEGVGYKWEVKGDTLHLNLGFSHPVAVKIPAIVKVVIEKGILVSTSIDKDALGQFVAYVRAFRKPEPFKGKGIRYEGEVIRRKEGKKTA